MKRADPDTCRITLNMGHHYVYHVSAIVFSGIDDCIVRSTKGMVLIGNLEAASRNIVQPLPH